MKYAFRIWNYDNKKIPLIQFADEQNLILSDLLNNDRFSLSSRLINEMLKQIEMVESGEKEILLNGSERVGVEITKKACKLFDNFKGFDMLSDEELYPDLTLPTSELKQIILDWKAKRAEMMAEIAKKEFDE